MNKQIALPAWLDHLVFEKYGGRYARHPEEVQYTILTKILILSKTTSGPISRVVLQKDIVS